MGDQVLAAAGTIISNAIDEEIERLDNILGDEQELDKLRKQRLAEMRVEQGSKQQWMSLGHGKLQDLGDQKEFFPACQQSERIVALFTSPSNNHGSTLAEQLNVVAARHPETRFVKLDAEKSPFLVDRLKIWMLPSVVLIKNEKSVHTLVGLSEISGTGKYEPWEVERCLFAYEMVTHQQLEEQASRIKD